ncbi:hypothetical protein F5Y19DRAFT_227258 [Xylariaceae sp. FL1651]|nr:hypothetical protein F5Y19DRAFT_227258 [Xylariaceae sp. FL1651]
MSLLIYISCLSRWPSRAELSCYYYKQKVYFMTSKYHGCAVTSILNRKCRQCRCSQRSSSAATTSYGKPVHAAWADSTMLIGWRQTFVSASIATIIGHT